MVTAHFNLISRLRGVKQYLYYTVRLYGFLKYTSTFK
jgi:hypothetical protein